MKTMTCISYIRVMGYPLTRSHMIQRNRERPSCGPPAWKSGLVSLHILLPWQLIVRSSLLYVLALKCVESGSPEVRGGRGAAMERLAMCIPVPPSFQCMLLRA